MEKAAIMETSTLNKKTNTQFSKVITSEIWNVLNTCFSEDNLQESIDRAVDILWEFDPLSSIQEGEFRGMTSLMLYCGLYDHAKKNNLKMEALEEIYIALINYSNLNIQAILTGVSPHTGQSALWVAVRCCHWDLVDKLIEKGADINATCTGEGPHKGKSVLWIVLHGITNGS